MVVGVTPTGCEEETAAGELLARHGAATWTLGV